MLPADPASDPRPSHILNVVDNSTHVKRESQFKAIYPHALVNSSRIAMDDSTEGFDALRDFDEQPFEVTRSPVVGDCSVTQTKEAHHAPVSRAGCTVNEGYQNSETHRLCRGLASPRVAQEAARGTPFAVTVNGRTVMVAPVPPALPQQIIPHTFPWPPADLARPVHPAIEVMQ